MHKFLSVLICLISVFGCRTTPPPVQPVQSETVKKKSPVKSVYRGSYARKADIIHTRLNVTPDWKNRQLNGQAAIIFRPYFYPTDSLIIDAKKMLLSEVSLSSGGRKLLLSYNYDSEKIRIKLDRVYSRDESFTIFINYIARPDSVAEGGSTVINDNQGLYFINSDSIDKHKPTQLWTQCETESASAWFPTIEDPGQRMTQEIYLTVDTEFTTISNGLLISSTDNYNGTKTDYWKQSLPAPPYLTMITVGKFAKVIDTWKNIEVSYYVDPPYEKYARMIFGDTPEMLSFFSEKLAVPYVWEKYAQVVVHDFVTGAMENASAVLHGTNMHMDSRELKDRPFEEYISHELFHHWFGNLVTCESWGSLALNEGFATYGEYLWKEHKYGTEEADYLFMNEMAGYLRLSANADPPLIRFEYEDKDHLYDAISYNKGGRVIHMLRKQVGDEAFFAALKFYLSRNMFSSVEVHDLRIAFENITGEDLNWFFDQWFLKGGHPVLSIEYSWDDSLRVQQVTIKQNQDLSKGPVYTLPIDLDIYSNGKVERKKIVVDDVEEVFSYPLPSKPDLVNVDSEKALLCEKTDNKPNEALIFQYYNAPLFLDRYEAVSQIGKSYRINTPESEMMIRALQDKHYAIRLASVNNIEELAKNDTGAVKSILMNLALSDASSVVRERAISALGKYYGYSEFAPLYSEALKDSSYRVVARAFRIISEKDESKAKIVASGLEKDSSTIIIRELAEYYSNLKDDKTEFFRRAVRLSDRSIRYQVIRSFSNYLKANENAFIISKGSEILYDRASRPAPKNFRNALLNALRDIDTTVKKKINDGEKEIDENADSIIKTEKLARLAELRSLTTKLNEKIASLGK